MLGEISNLILQSATRGEKTSKRKYANPGLLLNKQETCTKKQV